MKWFAVALSMLILISACSKPENSELYGEAIGTTYSVKIVNGPQGKDKDKLHREIKALFDSLNMQMSTYIKESAISQFNAGPSGELMPVSEPFLKVLNLAMQISVESGGAFDVTVGPAVNLWGFGREGRRNDPPDHDAVSALKNYVGYQNIKISGDTISKDHDKTELDFSAIAKGFFVDAVAGLLTGKGYTRFLVEIGGEVVVRGTNKNDQPWHIGIDRPLIEQTIDREFEAILEISDLAVATSGDYRNYFISEDSLYSHTIDPVTCRPIINGVASVTVIAPDCALADAMATAIMVMGEKSGLEWVESKPGIETMIILRQDDSFRVISSSGFENYVMEE
jgi:thiamine biosynthesis lipoprotein